MTVSIMIGLGICIFGAWIFLWSWKRNDSSNINGFNIFLGLMLAVAGFILIVAPKQ